MYSKYYSDKLNKMKKVFYVFTVLVVFGSISCAHIGDPVPQAQPCDNTTTPLTISLLWSGTYYLCTSSFFGGGNLTPPNATSANYMGYASVTGGLGSLSAPLSYLCTIVVKNDQPAANPNAPCSNPGMGSFTWTQPGPTHVVYNYVNQNTDVTVDYYDICAQCNPGSSANARPHFTGVITVPKGASQTRAVQMQTQTNYTTTNCQ